jgi:hypothetical protein
MREVIKETYVFDNGVAGEIQVPVEVHYVETPQGIFWASERATLSQLSRHSGQPIRTATHAKKFNPDR